MVQTNGFDRVVRISIKEFVEDFCPDANIGEGVEQIDGIAHAMRVPLHVDLHHSDVDGLRFGQIACERLFCLEEIGAVKGRATDSKHPAAADESDGTIAQMNSATAAVSPMRADRRTIDDFSSLTQRMDRM